MSTKMNVTQDLVVPQGDLVLFPRRSKPKTATYREKLLEQKIQLLELALKANIQNPSLGSVVDVAKARHDLFDFMRGGRSE